MQHAVAGVVDSMGRPAESQKNSEFWGTRTYRMSGSIWKGLGESSYHPVLAMGSPLSADDNLNTRVDINVPLTYPGTIDPVVLELVCQKNRVPHENRTINEKPSRGHFQSPCLVSGERGLALA